LYGFLSAFIALFYGFEVLRILEMRYGIFARLALAAAAVALIGGCAGLFDDVPGRYEKWAGLIDEMRAYERRIGFSETPNFLQIAEDQESFTYCGRVPRLQLPYSYEDPAIRWTHGISREECLALGRGEDVYFDEAEALGEIGTPLTRSMLDAPLERFLYLVFHEDCHDQFHFSAGIEEALCNVIAYQAMVAFTKERFGQASAEQRLVTGYVEMQSERSLLTRAYYRRLAVLYARYGRKELTSGALLRERDEVLRLTERVLGREAGTLNNVSIATDMTYDRYCPLFLSIHGLLGSDLARTVSFFKEVDARKPAPEQVMKRHKLRDEKSVAFIRAYEAAVIETVRRELESNL
jgi:hypothetical protein